MSVGLGKVFDSCLQMGFVLGWKMIFEGGAGFGLDIGSWLGEVFCAGRSLSWMQIWVGVRFVLAA